MKKLVKNKKALSPAEKAVLREALLKERDEAVSILEDAVAQNPFMYYEPSTQDIGEDRWDFLREHLKDVDMPVRLDSQEDVLCSKANIIGAGGGNGGGKSNVLTIMALIHATGMIPVSLQGKFPESLLIKKNTTKQLRIVTVSDGVLHNTVLPEFRRWTPRECLWKGSFDDSFSSKHTRLDLYKQGSKNIMASIEFKTNTQDVESHQGPSLDWIGFDEEPLYDIYLENRMRFRTSPRLQMMFAFTPTKGLSWSKDLFMNEDDDEGSEVETFQLSTVVNPANNLNTLYEMFVSYKNADGSINDEMYDELKMRLLGEYVSLSGLVYGKLFDRQVHVIPPFKVTKDYLCISGWDPHLVTPSAGVFLLVDREGMCYVDRCYSRERDTSEIKEDFHEIVKDSGYRMGWSVADKSANSTIIAFGGRNIFRELSRGTKSIPAMRTSEKYEGSIKAGVDVIKQRLKDKTFFVVNRPENKVLINSFKTLERETFANEDVKGKKDKIAEGKHHLHASLRYIFQFPINWYPEIDELPEPVYADEMVCA